MCLLERGVRVEDVDARWDMGAGSFAGGIGRGCGTVAGRMSVRGGMIAVRQVLARVCDFWVSTVSSEDSTTCAQASRHNVTFAPARGLSYATRRFFPITASQSRIQFNTCQSCR